MLDNTLSFPMARIDLERRWVEPVDGVPERLTTLEAKLLRFLAANTDRVVSRDELLTEVWGYAPTTVSRACDTTIRRLRTKIEPNPSEPECLLTVHGQGYRLVLARSAEPMALPVTTVPRRSIALPDRTIDLDRARVVVHPALAGGIEGPSGGIALTTNELAVIELLWASAGRSVDRDVLLRRIWGSSVGRPLDHAVGRLRKKLEVDPARPAVLVTTTSGYRLELGDGPALPARLPDPGNLPVALDRWVGRDEELAALFDRVDAGDRLVVLIGPGGAGKTRLAATAARRLAERRGGSGWWFDLTGVDRVEQVWAVLARELRLPTVGDAPEVQVVRALAALGPAVVVLDNLEELAGVAAAPILRLVEGAPNALFLGTSRILLRIQGERRLEVGPLAPADAEALFVDRAIRPPDPSEQPEVVALVAELEGMPLAIELAAASTRILSVPEIRRRSRERLLASGDRSRPERYRSLRASLDGSWELATPWARSALAQLSVFRGGFTIEAVERVLDLGAWPEAAWTLDVIEELVDASLVRIAPDGSRFTMLQVVSRYAAEQLDPGLRAAVEVNHGVYFASFGDPAVLAGADGPNEVELRRRLRFELDNLIVACERAIVRQDPVVASATACAASTVLELTGPVRAAADLLSRVAAMPGAEPRVATAAGQAFLSMGALDTSEAHFRRAPDDPYAWLGLADVAAIRNEPPRGEVADALAHAVATGDRVLECLARVELGMEHRRQADNEAAHRSFETALHLATNLGARRLTARVQRRLALLEVATGSLAEARSRLSRALASAIDIGARGLEATIVADLGAMAERAGGLAEGRSLLKASLELQRDIGDRLGESRTLMHLARHCSVEGLHEEAEQHFHDSLTLAREIGAFELEIATLGNWANHATRVGRPAEAERRLLEALAMARSHGFVRGEAIASMNLGNLYASTGRMAEAMRAFESGLVHHRVIGNRSAIGATLGNMGVAATELGDLERARALLLEALQIHREIGDRRLEAGWNQYLALVAVRAGDAETARPHVEAALEGHQAFGDRRNVARTLLVRAELEHLIGDAAAARTSLSEAASLLPEGVETERLVTVRRLVDPDGGTPPR